VARKPAEQTVNREDILVAAARVLLEKGYHRAKMEDIARVVDLTAGSLYHHFPDGKQEILLAVLNYGLDTISRQVESLIDSDLTSEEKLREAVKLHVTAVTDHVYIGAAMVFEIRTMLDIPEIRDEYVLRRDHFEELFRTLIQEGVDSGDFSPVDVKLFVRMILGAHNWVGVWYREDGPLTGEDIAQQMADWFIAALSKQAQ
jgi:TetR/AcrR family transcriptional regulator, cholesterol catabolism regulator